MHMSSRIQWSALWTWTGWMYQCPMSQQWHMSWYGRDVCVWMSGRIQWWVLCNNIGVSELYYVISLPCFLSWRVFNLCMVQGSPHTYITFILGNIMYWTRHMLVLPIKELPTTSESPLKYYSWQTLLQNKKTSFLFWRKTRRYLYNAHIVSHKYNANIKLLVLVYWLQYGSQTSVLPLQSHHQ